MFEKIKKVLKDYYNIENVELESDFKKDFGLTSFDFVNLICIFEDEFGIEFEESEYRSFNTIADIVNYLESKVQIL